MALGRNKASKEKKEDNNTVEISAQMQGQLTFSDPVNLKISGNFQGSLTTHGTLTIGPKADVDADITGDNIVLAGKLKGNITARKMLVIMPSGVLYGDIETPKLNIVEGAVFQGHCIMSGGESGLLDIDEVAKYLEIDLKEIEAMANSGKIPAKKSGNGWKFERAQIDTWAASGKVR